MTLTDTATRSTVPSGGDEARVLALCEQLLAELPPRQNDPVMPGASHDVDGARFDDISILGRFAFANNASSSSSSKRRAKCSPKRCHVFSTRSACNTSVPMPKITRAPPP